MSKKTAAEILYGEFVILRKRVADLEGNARLHQNVGNMAQKRRHTEVAI